MSDCLLACFCSCLLWTCCIYAFLVSTNGPAGLFIQRGPDTASLTFIPKTWFQSDKNFIIVMKTSVPAAASVTRLTHSQQHNNTTQQKQEEHINLHEVIILIFDFSCNTINENVAGIHRRICFALHCPGLKFRE